MTTPLKELEAATFGTNRNADTSPPLLADIIQEIEQTILKYIELEAAEIATLLALWIVQSYQIAAFAFCGFLGVQSASPRCGKSRLLEVLGCFTAELTPLRTMPTPAVLYRNERQVIFLDEVDALRNADKEKYGDVMALLNVAFKRGGIVERCNKTTLKVESFPAYRAFAFAGLNRLSDTLSDRCFPIRLKRATRKMKRLHTEKVEAEFKTLRDTLSRWWDQNGQDVVRAYERLPDETTQLNGFDDRMQDISEPLLVLALCADAEREQEPLVTQKLLKAIETINSRRDPSSVEDSLKAFLTVIEEKMNCLDYLFTPTHEVLDLCKDTEGLEWLNTARLLKSFLKKFDLFPKPQAGKVRGYGFTQEWVQEWRGRYA